MASDEFGGGEALAVQRRRLARSAAVAAAFNASLYPRASAPAPAPAPAGAVPPALTSPLRVLEGAVPPGSATRQLDPLGLARMRYDVPPDQTLQEFLAPETAALREAFTRHGIARLDGDYRETLRVAHAVPNEPDLIVRVQNIVHTNTISTNALVRDLDSDDESEQGDGAQRKHPASAVAAGAPSTTAYRRHARVDDDDDDDVGNGDVGNGGGDDDGEDVRLFDDASDMDIYMHAAATRALADNEAEFNRGLMSLLNDGDAMDIDTPGSGSGSGSRSGATRVLFSQRQVQRRWLGMGFHKNRVGTAIGLHYARPWSASHLVFPKGRTLGTGTNNRIVDRVLLKYGLCAYLRKAGVHGVGLKTRISQNFVAKCQLPTKTGLCLSRICQSLKDKAHPTKEFTGIVVNWPPATLLLFEHGSMICIGTSSVAQLRQAVSTVAPVVMANFRTPENEQDEQELFRLGVLKDFTAEQVRPRLAEWDAEASKRRRRNNEARRRPKVRYMGVF